MKTDHIKEQPMMVEITKIEDEAENIKTFYLDVGLKSKPGQFVILWIPRLDEKPFSIGFDNEKELRLTIAKVGEFTSKLFEYKVGDKIGVRGPYGKPFNIEGLENKKIALVGGGYGAAPLSYLAAELAKNNNEIHFITGARTENILIYREKLANSGYNLYYTTDDGSFGTKGFVTTALKKILEENKMDKIFTVGPEMMMKAVVELSDEYNVDCDLSLERYMKCGIGVCGVCCVDPIGIRMCKEGPNISKEIVKKITEFGKYHRDASGKKVYF
ncbi:dihydroorotate dehydrogenase electron transfer subunit [archaeon]|jgi:dihydroorotate dehydrogenase electron transfer subunit|nr:dihydroorotate dehydrogenase electron transfer subunit [archaeon]MBT4351865.1 dihydroorotate dehydrogenase electron transfer subunit [archaeon]MBT4647681.1 dihydroorotate dehydrogenase electron transfer subunit [archaeon]MBT6822353.1 dihydroorotate dehydrogenase electron transfer subunit [archaeon]MBT7391501.1 dihydroorotate dehydrogenase electron transfer subunit [archaeon]